MKNDILMLNGEEIRSLLKFKEDELINIVQKAYEVYAKNIYSLPHSTFLKFRNDDKNRIIALPAYLNDGFNVAGIKWISSFPENVKIGLDRASAIMMLNSLKTGRVKAILESSIISSKRTAASASLAIRCLQKDNKIFSIGLIGCGLINFEILKFISYSNPSLKKIYIFDVNIDKANYFKEKCNNKFNTIEIEIVKDINRIFMHSSVISLATTVSVPYIFDISQCLKGSLILNISLRDLSPDVIMNCDNIVDDIDHVCRAGTSIHLTEQLVGNRDFIRCTLSDILLNKISPKNFSDKVTVFSPFGLGILDIAVASFVYKLGIKKNKGIRIEGFQPEKSF
ncbi:MAG: 2,3-diaminopropionate biosynthesis protein SbnB [Bacteroidetes bacterium]|nr:2,3-diaminopropionate biosynthesis protein SbnB [Bacteroidota bacterium]